MPSIGFSSPWQARSVTSSQNERSRSVRSAVCHVCSVPHAEIRLGNGDVYTVEGSLDEVERGLSDAARSGQARLAWFKEQSTAESIGINPAHVAALRGSETAD